MTQKIVYLLSSNYSGSHFLSLMLGSHSRFEHLGELKNTVKATCPCATCGDVASCALLGGLAPFLHGDIYGEIFRRLPPTAEVLVDTSKKPEWFRARDACNPRPVYRLHLLRDPRALARRWLLRFAEQDTEWRERIKMARRRPAGALKFLFGDLIETCTHKWLHQNREISAYLAASGGSRLTVTYEELAQYPQVTLETITRWLGHTFEPGQTAYWKYAHHGTEKHEYEWVKSRGDNAFFDLRWQQFLDSDQQRRITTNRHLAHYLDGLGLAFSDTGLTHRHS
jgi:hypothetical protein